MLVLVASVFCSLFVVDVLAGDVDSVGGGGREGELIEGGRAELVFIFALVNMGG